MAHFAQLDDNNVVTQVIVVDNNELRDPHTGEEDEILGIAFCKKLFGGKWIQTSYNNKMRVRYAGIGYHYHPDIDAFVPPKPYESWVLNSETTIWEAPVPRPELTTEQIEAGSSYQWNEENVEWQIFTPQITE